MGIKLRSKLMLLFMSLAMVVAIPAVALADQITNSLDASVDTTAETMALNEGGSNGTTTIYVNPANDDGKQGCNMKGDSITVSLASSNTSVATVSPSSITLDACELKYGKAITVTPVKAGTATITASGPASINGGSLTYGEATFTVNVAPPANTAPKVSVTGVSDKSQYEYGSVPKAECSVVDAEDGNKTFDATLSAISGPNSALGLGNQTASCEYTDAGGLKTSAAATYEIVDTTAPVIKDAGTTQVANNGWYKTDVTNNFTASDNVALADSNQASFSKTTTGEGLAVKVSSGTVKDVVGNEAIAVDSQGFQIDKTAPIIKDEGPDALVSEPNTAGWYNKAVSNKFSTSDTLSGFAGGETLAFAKSSGTDQGNAVIIKSGTVSDLAGNVGASINSAEFKIDMTVPTLNPSVSPNPVLLNGIATASANAADQVNLSGLASQSCDPVDTSSVGSKSVKCSATDNAGNSANANASYSVTYDFKGFFQPIDNKDASGNLIFNKAKAGSTIPVKFSLGGNQGMDILAATPSTVSVIAPASASTDLIEETTTATSGLKYDAGANQYVYNWKTNSGWAGTSRQLIVKLADGTVHRANFTFTK